ncbi:MAG: hypothetical protein AAFN10_02720 [Bacteroidota bacterium]
MLRTNCLFIVLLVLFLFGGTDLVAQTEDLPKLPLYFSAQLGIGQGNQVYDRWPDLSLSLSAGWKMQKLPFTLGLGFTSVRGMNYVVRSYRQLDGIGLQAGYVGKRFAMQAEIGRALQYLEGYSDEGYGFYFEQDGAKATYWRVSPMIRLGRYITLHLSWFETSMAEGALTLFNASAPYQEEGRDQRFLRSFHGGIGFLL